MADVKLCPKCDAPMDLKNRFLEAENGEPITIWQCPGCKNVEVVRG